MPAPAAFATSATPAFRQQLRLLLGVADQSWCRAHLLEDEARGLAGRRQALQQALPWCQVPLERARLLKDAEKVEGALEGLSARLARAREQALVDSERAAALGWGVRLGRRYRVASPDMCTEFLVEELRPCGEALPECQMLMGGRDPRGPRLFVLGLDELLIEPAQGANVVDIRARLAARKH
jgi:hypothetical protein